MWGYGQTNEFGFLIIFAFYYRIHIVCVLLAKLGKLKIFPELFITTHKTTPNTQRRTTAKKQTSPPQLLQNALSIVYLSSSFVFICRIL
jgi:hypothetical protein